MKKLIFILIMTLCLSFTACNNNNNNENRRNTEIKNMLYMVDKVKVDNHDYVIPRTTSTGGGISIIHSESCPCNKNKKIE